MQRRPSCFGSWPLRFQPRLTSLPAADRWGRGLGSRPCKALHRCGSSVYAGPALAASRGRLSGLELKPGTVKRARAEAHLSLAGLAQQDITRAALHLIERGQSRATLPTLRLIASRTNKPLEYFLKPGQEEVVASQERQLDPTNFEEIELALIQERFEDAVTIGERLRTELIDRHQRARAALHLAEAHLRQANVQRARDLLEEAHQHAEEAGDQWMLADVLDWQAAALYLLEDPQALATARSALRLAQSLDPLPDPTIVRINGRIGAICVAQHKWQEAIEAFSAAIEAGGTMLDLSRKAKMYNDLSIAYRRRGELMRAVEYARKAIEIHELLQDRLSIARAETNLALVLARQHDLDSAGAHLAHALELFDGAGQSRGRSHILLAQAEVALNRSDLKVARAKAEEALELAASLSEKATHGEAYQVLGTIAVAEGNVQEMSNFFGRAIATFEALGARERLLAAHSAYARALEAVGETEEALRQWRYAVASTHPEAAGVDPAQSAAPITIIRTA